MEKLTQPILREIIDDFAKEIEQKKLEGPKPAKWVINFRNEQKDGIERPIYYVPIELLRFRKHNGRISSDVMSYEKYLGPIDEVSVESQRILRDFLAKKDPEKTEELKQAIKQSGQKESAIITCDGFLINGNRRKMVFDKVHDDDKGNEDFKRMKVVILPGKNDPGGPPTTVEIEELENRYQFQKEGKAEYYGFDKALSIRRKISLGISLEQLLKDDPTLSGLDAKRFKAEVNKVRDELLNPLECVDRYLCHLGRDGLYNTVTSGTGDREGRWQAFIDYYTFVYSKLVDEQKRIKLGINEDEVGEIEDVAFKIIRMRELPSLPKSHQIMRKLPKLISHNDSKKELLKLIKVDSKLPKEETIDHSGKEKDHREQDKIWQSKNKGQIVSHLSRAMRDFEFKEDKETPVKLLEGALKKLNHENMDPESISIYDLKHAMRVAEQIVIRADELKSTLFQLQKKTDKLARNTE
jgi:hypothetical protein